MTTSRSNTASCVGMQFAPEFDRLLPGFRAWRKRSSLDVIERGLIAGDQAGARSGLDGHVTNRHAAFHGKVGNGFAGKLDGAAGAAGRADLHR